MTKRMVCYIPGDALVKGHGYRVSFVKEGEPGHYPTGNWPYNARPGQSMPWFWGDDYDKACMLAIDYNKKLGISEEEAFKIVGESMGLSIKAQKKGRQ